MGGIYTLWYERCIALYTLWYERCIALYTRGSWGVSPLYTRGSWGVSLLYTGGYEVHPGMYTGGYEVHPGIYPGMGEVYPGIYPPGYGRGVPPWVYTLPIHPGYTPHPACTALPTSGSAARARCGMTEPWAQERRLPLGESPFPS